MRWYIYLHLRPLRIPYPWVAVRMRRDITRATRVTGLKPCATDVGILLINDILNTLEKLCFVGKGNPGDSRPDHDDLDWLWRANVLVFDG